MAIEMRLSTLATLRAMLAGLQTPALAVQVEFPAAEYRLRC